MYVFNWWDIYKTCSQFSLLKVSFVNFLASVTQCAPYTHSLRIISLITWYSAHIYFLRLWMLPLTQMQIQYSACQSAEQKRDFLSFTPSIFSAFGWTCSFTLCSIVNGEIVVVQMNTRAFASLSLLFPVPKRFSTTSLSAKESPWFPLMMFPGWYSRTSTGVIHTLVKWLLPSNSVGFVCISLSFQAGLGGEMEKKQKYPLPPRWVLSTQPFLLP